MKLRTPSQFITILIFILSSCKQKEPSLCKAIIDKTIQTQKESSQSASVYHPSSKFDHIKYIRQNSRIGQTDGIEHDPKYFIDYAIEELLESKHHKKYITDRKLLRRLRNKTCWTDFVSIVDTLLNGDNIEIEIKTQDFNPTDRRLKYDKKSNYLVSIDDKYP
ncbi:MAG: hypothetical protein P1U56_03300 [Saprospiraceae bacterium]|nr:hypothetical protein [Saprospiraceae bacterium]